jgi:hypothetical protein
MILRSLVAPNHGVRFLAHTHYYHYPRNSANAPLPAQIAGFLRLGPVGVARTCRLRP